MRKGFLEDYTKREQSAQEKYYSQLMSNPSAKIDLNYPDSSRFLSLHDPVVIANVNAYKYCNEKIWSQIPFAGTLIIPLSPSKADNFLMEHSFDRNDIDKLIDFSKDTGRVQFVLNSSPRLYENSDHLESVFCELEPPVLSIPWQLFGG